MTPPPFPSLNWDAHAVGFFAALGQGQVALPLQTFPPALMPPVTAPAL